MAYWLIRPCNCPIANLHKLQRVQNNLACNACSCDRSTDAKRLLQQLHWLPIECRVNFKVAKLCYQAVNCSQPTYLASLLKPYVQTRTLRSGSSELLFVPAHRIDIAARRFSVACPSSVEYTPTRIRTAPSVARFKSRLKSYLFSPTFSH